MKLLIFIILFLLFIIPTGSAQILNGDFEDYTEPPPVWNHWINGNFTEGSINDVVVQYDHHAYTGTYGWMGRSFIKGNGETESSLTTYSQQNVDFTGYNNLTFYYKLQYSNTPDTKEGCIYVGNNKHSLPFTDNTWTYYNIDVSGYEGVKTLRMSAKVGLIANVPVHYWVKFQIDDIALTNFNPVLYGYVTNNLGNPVSAATITLNNSGGSTTSNDTGYYRIEEIPSGTYTISATSPTHIDYSDTVSITTNTEKNISMTRLTPTLSNVGIIDSSENTLRIGWKENAVVDSVRIYQGTNTNLIATEDTSYISLASYTVGNLDADTGYNFWLEPWDGAVSGIKYYVSGTTDGDGGGGGGGGGGDPTPTATGTPGPTPPPWTNITDEDWLNLTRYEQEYILFEHDQLNITIGTYTPKPINLSFWYLILFLGICSTAYGSQKKNGEVLFTCGLVTVVISMIKLGLF